MPEAVVKGELRPLRNPADDPAEAITATGACHNRKTYVPPLGISLWPTPVFRPFATQTPILNRSQLLRDLVPCSAGPFKISVLELRPDTF
jgi:hypothetical protein